jgi:RNA polymerase sigma-70 factor (ECF subfamily)
MPTKTDAEPKGSTKNRAEPSTVLVRSRSVLWYRSDDMPLGEEALAHLDALYRVARRLTGGDERARDLVQDTFIRALAAQDQFERGTNLRAWLFRILRNAHVDDRRRARVAPFVDGEAPRPATPSDVEQVKSAVADDVERALASLGPDARTIILLDLEGFTETELARVLDCPVGTIKSRLSRARAALRERLADYRSDR